MDVLQLVVDLVGALAWPLVVLTALLLLRQPLSRALSERLTKIKLPGFEAELERARVEAEAAIATNDDARAVTAVTELPDEFDGLTDRDPTGAILSAYELLGRVLRERLTTSGTADGLPATANANRLAAAAASAGLITPQSAESVQGLTVLRNLVAHGIEREVTSTQARDYVAMVAATIYSFRKPGTPPSAKEQ